MKKVLFTINSIGGLYKFRFELIEAVLNNGFAVAILCPYGDKVEEFKKLGCEFYEIDFSRHGTNPFAEIKLKRKYRKMLKIIKPDIVLSYTIKPNIYAGCACSNLKIPYITNITGLGTAVENGGIMQKITTCLYRKALKKCNMCFFQNSKNMEFFVKKKIVKDRYALLPGSGVNLDLNAVEDYPNDLPIKYLFVGRLMKDKGYTEYVIAAKKVLESGANVEFYSIGPCEKEYAATLDRIDADKYIKWYGEVNNVHEYMKNCHVVVLPSYHEGMANVLLEAAATGRPVIATNVPGCIETYDDNISGLSCEPKDSDSLYAAMMKFSNMTFESRRQMGKAGREKTEKQFDRKIVVNTYLNQIKSILE